MVKNNLDIITIAELRAKKGKMTQLQLAEALGTSQTSVSLWESDINTISTPYLVKLCRFFGVSADRLLGIWMSLLKFYTLYVIYYHVVRYFL